MKIVRDIEDVRNVVRKHRMAGHVIGFVPTMGALHEGHIALVQKSISDNDITFVSIFVNPTQFNNSKDLQNYPRTEESDFRLLENQQVDYVFVPSSKEIYPETYGKPLTVDFGILEKSLEGKFRPGHFSGVGLIVAKLFNLVQPDYAYFGQKDLQQFLVVQKLVHDLSMPVELICHPIVREEDGLAMSSRNQRLTAMERKIAPSVYRALLQVKKGMKQGLPLKQCKELGRDSLSKIPGITLEYIEVVNKTTFELLLDGVTTYNTSELAICIAAFLGNVRLIDNIFADEP